MTTSAPAHALSTSQILGPQVPASAPAQRPSAPRWRDTRLLLGLLLVLASVVAGSRVVAGAQHLDQVWSAARPLPSGTRIAPGDLQLQAVRLGSAADSYLRASDADPVGSVLSEPVAAGDLLPRSAIGGQHDDAVEVTVPVEPYHLPPALDRGGLVDVFVTQAKQGGQVSTSPAQGLQPEQPVLRRVLVVSVDADSSRFGGSGSSIGVVLQVSPEQAGLLVAAARDGDLDLVGDSA